MIEDLRDKGLLNRAIRFFLENKLAVLLLVIFLVAWGLMVAPFDWNLGGLPRNPVPVDAIPDIGENQQIVFTEWMGRSPQDVEDQVTYPLASVLSGVPGVKTVRSYSMFGFSTIYLIFAEDVDFYWSRSRVLERLNSLPADALPEGVQPRLGPDATALGQIFWYTLEGRDEKDQPAGGWELQELRSIQDYYVRYSLLSAEGVAEVASVGGYVKEYQIDVDPDAMRAFGVKLEDVAHAVRSSNQDVGASSIEMNRVEYIIRGVGFIQKPEDIENAVITVNENIPVYVKNVARVALGPALRMGALDKEGVEAVGGVVTARYGGNPLETINNVKKKIAEIAPGLPVKTLPDGTSSQVKIVPFYDRSGLIHETLGTLNKALTEQILITIIVILIMIMRLRSSILISGLLPLAVLMCFIAMRIFRVDANIVALSGIAIAIGAIVDMGIIVCENILKRLDEADKGENSLETVYRAVSEVGGAVVTAISTTVVGFLPVFTMEAAEGKLFKPLAFTKTFALFSSVIIALLILPAFAHILFAGKIRKGAPRLLFYAGLVILGIVMCAFVSWWMGILILLPGVFNLMKTRIPEKANKIIIRSGNVIAVLAVVILLTKGWLPLGADKGLGRNFLFVSGIIGSLMLFFFIYQRYYERILRWCLERRMLFLTAPFLLVLIGGMVWLGFPRIFGWLPHSVKTSKIASAIWHKFPGLGREFMPPLDEGSYLFMPTTMPHASFAEALDVLQTQDRAIRNVPEVESVVGKLGRAETPLDPAPMSMFETVINYLPEYLIDSNGRRLSFKYDSGEVDLFRNKTGDPLPAPDGKPYFVRGAFLRDEHGSLIPDSKGKPFRLWRPALETSLNPGRKAWRGVVAPQDIWDEILRASRIPGTTSAPLLQPIAARIVMLQSGMRAPMGVKIKGPDLETIEKVGLELERFLKLIPSVEPSAVIADRIVGKPYLEIRIDREAIARYGVNLNQVQDVIETAIGGKKITTTVEGRERYPVRVRYMRELRDSVESLDKILVPAPDGSQIPLIQLAQIEYERGPQMIKSEDAFLVGYVLFDKKPGWAEVEVVEQARTLLNEKIKNGELRLPAGVSLAFAGNYENQARAQKKLTVILPLSLFIIFMILYFNFRSAPTAMLVFSGILVAWAGGFIMIWLYAQSWFLDFSVFGVNMRDLFQVHPINLSVAVWVGFLALFGIASDDGVVMATYLDQTFKKRKPASIAEIREATVIAGTRRIRACMMTTATTVLALIPILTSTGRGADIMVPMAIPSFGGMMIEVLTTLIVPVLYNFREELKFKRNQPPTTRELRKNIV